MIDGIADVLELENRAEIGKGPERLQIAGTRRQILAGLDMGGRVEAAEEAEIGSLRADVRDLEQHAARQFVLKAGRPLLHVGRAARCGRRRK